MTKRDRPPTNDTALSPEALDHLFDAARATNEPVPPDPSADLLARVLDDALAAQPRIAPTPPVLPVWQGLRASLGGWLGVGGLAMAGVSGLVIGLASPDLVPGGTAFDAAAVTAVTADAADMLVVDPLVVFDVSLLLEEDGL